MENRLVIDERVSTYNYKGQAFEIKKAHIENIESKFADVATMSGYVAIDHRMADENGLVNAGHCAAELFYHETIAEVFDAVQMAVDVEGMTQAEMMAYFMARFSK